MNLAGEVRDREAVLLAVVGAVAAFAVARDWRVVLTAAVGVLAVKAGAGRLLHGAQRIPDEPLPGLTAHDSAVARLIHAGYGDPAIAMRLGIALTRVERRIQRIYAIWHVSTRSEIARHVAQVIGEPLEPPIPRRKQRWELIAEVGTGVAVMALGLGILTMPPDTPLIGSWRDWIGLTGLTSGLLFAVVSIAMYLWEHGHTGPHP
jgi:DNA-binding CsgD family transcriptional regulator